MKRKKLYLFLPLLLLNLLLSACGSGGSGDSITSAGTGITSGVVVDPYIVGAYLEEVSADGQNLIQRTSLGATSNSGRFQFSEAITAGSIIRIKTSQAVMHAGAPYAGVLKRQVVAGESNPVVVSPLTTLVANGMTVADVIQMMNGAGFNGITEAGLYSDPMESLLSKVGPVTDADLVLLQANMAINAFMEATDNYNFAGGVSSTPVQAVTLADCADVIKATLNPTLYQQLASSLGADFTVGDMANTAARMSRTVVQGIPAASTPLAQQIDNALAGVNTIAANFYQSRKGSPGPGTTDPGPVVSSNNGEAIFTSNCSDCHSNGTGTSVMNLANDGAKVATKFGNNATHKGNALTASQIADLAAYLDNQVTPSPAPPSPVPGTDPGAGTPPTGSQLYATDCQGCHGSLSTSDIVGRTASALTAAITAVNGMNGLILNAEEIQLIADALAAETAPIVTPPAVARTGQQAFDQLCASCHALGTHDTTGIDLAGLGTAVVPKIQASHQNKDQAMTPAELTALATFADTFTPPVVTPPAVARTGQQAFDQLCASCHALGTHDTSGIDLAGLGTAIIPKIQASHQNRDQAMTPGELTALAAFADTFTAPTTGGTGGACDSCHGQPPAGNSFPNTAGAHGVHTALTAVGTACDNCHTGATHNDWVDLGFPAKWNAESGVATDNGDGTCSSIICHGGQQTPDWTTGTINVATQCRSCHVSGSTQYNGYASGEHRKHVNNENLDCLVCHDETKLRDGHFGDLSTTVFEKDPATTLKSFLNYNNGGCNPSGCHGSERW